VIRQLQSHPHGNIAGGYRVLWHGDGGGDLTRWQRTANED